MLFGHDGVKGLNRPVLFLHSSIQLGMHLAKCTSIDIQFSSDENWLETDRVGQKTDCF